MYVRYRFRFDNLDVEGDARVDLGLRNRRSGFSGPCYEDVLVSISERDVAVLKRKFFARLYLQQGLELSDSMISGDKC
jgi:hypothetical protein